MAFAKRDTFNVLIFMSRPVFSAFHLLIPFFAASSFYRYLCGLWGSDTREELLLFWVRLSFDRLFEILYLGISLRYSFLSPRLPLSLSISPWLGTAFAFFFLLGHGRSYPFYIFIYFKFSYSWAFLVWARDKSVTLVGSMEES